VPKTLDQKTALRLLQQNGWKKGERANHGIKMQAPGRRPVILPRFRGRPYPKSLNSDIIRQAGLNPKEVRAWISRSKSIKRDRDTGRTL
jgi:hypothetical protein